jgi:hypothetical protein
MRPGDYRGADLMELEEIFEGSVSEAHRDLVAKVESATSEAEDSGEERWNPAEFVADALELTSPTLETLLMDLDRAGWELTRKRRRGDSKVVCGSRPNRRPRRLI